MIPKSRSLARVRGHDFGKEIMLKQRHASRVELLAMSNMPARIARAFSRLPRPGARRRFIRRQDGTAAVEFGLVAAPFLALLFAIIDSLLGFNLTNMSGGKRLLAATAAFRNEPYTN
jgi:Flp pilus assembly pilin Flp